MKRIIPLFICLLTFVAQAQPKDDGKHPGFEKFLQEKVSFILAEMRLPASDSARFVPVYKELQQAKGKLFAKYSVAARNLRCWHKEHKGEPAPDSLYLRAVRSEAQLNLEDARLEQQYIERFEKILKPRQLSDYMRAEKKFKAKFMRRDAPEAKDRGDAKGGKDPHVRSAGPTQPSEVVRRESRQK